MSDHLSVEEIDDVELPGAQQRLDDTQLSRTVQGLDGNQIPRAMLAIKSMSDEQGQRIIQTLDPSKNTRIQNFGGAIFWGTNIQSSPGKPDHPTFCDKLPHKRSTGEFACDCGWHDSGKAVADIILSYYALMKQDGVLRSHVEGGPNEYMCRACVHDKPGRFNTYDLSDFNDHMTKKHIVRTSDPDDSIRRSYRDYLGPRAGYSFEP